jgi:hypothetical protein
LAWLGWQDGLWRDKRLFPPDAATANKGATKPK